jgi:propanediol dehydratase large subunit
MYLFLGSWILLTILYQNDKLRKKVNNILRFNDFNLIPIWTLFAPNPLAKDYYIVYRDFYSDGNVSELKVYEQRYIAILHKRHDKAILTIIFNILKNKKLLKEQKEKILFAQPEFKKLQYIVKKHDYNSKIAKRQFSIVDMVRIDQTESFNPIIVSTINYNS